MSQLEILTKSKEIIFKSGNSQEENKRVELYPFKWKNFKKVIEIIKRYWGCYKAVRDDYNKKVEEIIDLTAEDEDKERRINLLDKLDATYEEIPQIVQNVFNDASETVADDIQILIEFCLREVLDFDSLHLGEITCLVAAVIEVNSDFFMENMEKITKQIKIVPQVEIGESA